MIMSYVNFALIVVILFVIQYKVRIEKRPDGYYLACTKDVWDDLTRTFEPTNYRKKLF